jgi:phage terminase large subunit
MIDATINAYLFNPVFWHVLDALNNPRIRKIMVRGGSSAGKTFSICDAFNIRQLETVYNVFALRREKVHVETTIKKSFQASIDRLGPLRQFYEKMDREVRVATGSITTYSGLDDPEKVKGLEGYRVVYVNELNQFSIEDWEELQRRLRGNPDQKLVADWNPIISTHWINKEILDPGEGWTDLPLDLPGYERGAGAFTRLDPDHSFKRINAAGDTLWINVTYRDNFWIVGHPGNTVKAKAGSHTYRDADPGKPVTLEEGSFVAPDGNLYGFIDVHTIRNFERMKIKKPNDYRIYGLGQDGLMRTGGEFWQCFDETRHTRDLKYEPGVPIWASLDNNYLPYVTISLWQCVQREDESGIFEIRQIGEVVCKPPNNTAVKAAKELDKWLSRIGYKDALVVCGDPSGKNRSTVDPDGRSFFDKFIQTAEVLGIKVINRVARSAPEVALSAEFINDIYDELIEGWRIVIGKNCETSLEDYNLVKMGPDGKMLKEKVEDPVTLQKLEKYGHFSDAKRYLVITMLQTLFLNYKKSSRTARIMSVKE